MRWRERIPRDRPGTGGGHSRDDVERVQWKLSGIYEGDPIEDSSQWEIWSLNPPSSLTRQDFWW